MRLMFIHHVLEDRGSAQDMFHYARIAQATGARGRAFRPARQTVPVQLHNGCIVYGGRHIYLRVHDPTAIWRLVGLGQDPGQSSALTPCGDRLRRKVQRRNPR